MHQTCIHACILEIIITDVPDDGLCMNALNNKKNISIKIVKIKLSLIYIDTNKDFVENHFKKFFYWFRKKTHCHDIYHDWINESILFIYHGFRFVL